MLMKRTLLVSLFAVLVISIWAQAISEQDAKVRALRFLQSSDRAMARHGGSSASNIQLTAAKVGAQKIFAFNCEGGGYVIASGDSRALPVLGYSENGIFDWDRMPENIKGWLKSYDEAITTLGDCQFIDGNPVDGKAMTRRDEKTAIVPLLTTKWNQNAPYNDQCPVYDGDYAKYKGEKSLTGCVATAMAQVMAYHKWPREACTEIPAYDFEFAFEGNSEPCHLDALPSVTFKWDQMLGNYTQEVPGTDMQRAAVAELMYYCGQAVNMNFSPASSGAESMQAAVALRKYFGYDLELHNVYRSFYSIEEWENLVYQELAEGRPVQYDGFSDSAGHSFVCDGYDGNGMFHINWGWGGANDGYFSLSVLNPYNNTSAGSGSSGIGYCIRQDCLIGVKPASGETEYEPLLPKAALWDAPWVENTYNVGILYEYHGGEFEEMSVSLGLGTCSADGVLAPMFVVRDTLPNSGNYMERIRVDPSVFQKSTMIKLFPMIKMDIENSNWQLLGGLGYYIIAGKTFNDIFFLGKDMPTIIIKNAAITKGHGYLRERSDITLTLRNDGEEYNGFLYLTPLYLGDSTDEGLSEASEDDAMQVGAYLPSGKNTDVTFSFIPKRRGQVKLSLHTLDMTSLGSSVIHVNDTLRMLNDYVTKSQSVELESGILAQTICLKKKEGVKYPEGAVLDERLFMLSTLLDAEQQTVTSIRHRVPEEFVKILQELDESDNDSVLITHEYILPQGGEYILSSSAVGVEDGQQIYDYWLEKNSITMNTSPGLTVKGDTIVGSGQPIELNLLVTTGYPYTSSDFTGKEKAKWELYRVLDANPYDMVTMGDQTLSFSSAASPLMAVVDTISLNYTLDDGQYKLHVECDWGQMPVYDIHLTVGGETGIQRVEADRQGGVYYDLQGRRLEGVPARKGLYLHRGRKVINK